MDHLRAITDRLVAVGPTGAWMSGPRISFEDVCQAKGLVERVAPAELFKSAQSASDSPPIRPPYSAQTRLATQSAVSTTASSPKRPPTMGFGKFRDRLMSEVQEEHPGYWSWCVRDVNGFEKRARAAGLLDDL